MEHLTDPKEIRKLLDQVAYGRSNLDGTQSEWSDKINFAQMLIHNIFDMARFTGLTGEDRMTILAYQALLAYERASQDLIHMHNITPRRMFIGNTSSPKGE